MPSSSTQADLLAAAAELAAALKAMFADQPRIARRVIIPETLLPAIRKASASEVMGWREVSRRRIDPGHEHLATNLHDFAEVRRSLRTCRRVAHRAIDLGTAGEVFRRLLHKVLRGRLIDSFDDEWERAWEDEGEVVVPCDVVLRSPNIHLVEEMKNAAINLPVNGPAPGPRREPAKDSKNRTLEAALYFKKLRQDGESNQEAANKTNGKFNKICSWKAYDMSLRRHSRSSAPPGAA